ncbi:MAG: hypothetical protein AAF391_03525 [Bacteroidota bacterium]
MTPKKLLTVLKFGTTSVCDSSTLAIRDNWMLTVAEDVKDLLTHGQGVLIFSSGGLATGKKRAIKSNLNQEILLDKNTLGAIGLSELLFKWQQAFDRVGLSTATLTITEDDVTNTPVCSLIERLLDQGITPIINENIPLQTSFNNDELAARICNELAAERFVLFTDTDGIYTDNPKTNPDAEHLQSVNINDLNLNVDDQNAGLGSGGMKAKLEAAIKVKRTGTRTIIANGVDMHPLRNLGNAEKCTILLE